MKGSANFIYLFIGTNGKMQGGAVTKKRGQSADLRHPRSNTDAAHTDHSHASHLSYAPDS
jgi:hypothetical protein